MFFPYIESHALIRIVLSLQLMVFLEVRQMGPREVFRMNHLIRLAESIKTKRSNVTFLKDENFLLLCLSNQIYYSKNILLDCEKSLRNKMNILFPYMVKVRSPPSIIKLSSLL